MGMTESDEYALRQALTQIVDSVTTDEDYARAIDSARWLATQGAQMLRDSQWLAIWNARNRGIPMWRIYDETGMTQNNYHRRAKPAFARLGLPAPPPSSWRRPSDDVAREAIKWTAGSHDPEADRP